MCSCVKKEALRGEVECLYTHTHPMGVQTTRDPTLVMHIIIINLVFTARQTTTNSQRYMCTFHSNYIYSIREYYTRLLPPKKYKFIASLHEIFRPR